MTGGEKSMKESTNQELKCCICGKLASEDSHFYKTKLLCNKHYTQLHRYGKIIDNKPNYPRPLSRKCDICGDINSCNYTIWHSKDEYNGLELCSKHYMQMRNHGNLLDEMPSGKKIERVCCICGSDHHVIYSRIYNGMYCLKHYSQLYKLGEVKEITVFDKNQYYIKDDVAFIILRDSKHNIVAEAKIDIDDLERVIQYKWGLNTWGYAENTSKGLMQRFLLNEYDKNKIPDHINRDRLDNRKENLRIVNKSQNSINSGLRRNNTSGVTGVSWLKATSTWRAYINYQGRRIELGHYKNIDDAITARLNAENCYYPGMQPQKEIFKKYGVELYGK